MAAEYVLELFEESELIDEDAVLEFWDREGAMQMEEARRRLEELFLIATLGEELVAVSTAVLQWSPRLRLNLWNFRSFVAERHRESGVSTTMSIWAHEYAAARYVSGEETRGAGGLLEVENEMLKRYLNQAVWLPYGYTFIDENENGDHVRVGFYPGALVPDPPSPTRA
jgi:hypothetical protein